MLVTLTQCLVPYVSMQGPQQMEGGGNQTVLGLGFHTQQEVFASGAPPRTRGRDQDTQRLEIKGGSSSEGSCRPSAFAVSRDTRLRT